MQKELAAIVGLLALGSGFAASTTVGCSGDASTGNGDGKNHHAGCGGHTGCSTATTCAVHTSCSTSCSNTTCSTTTCSTTTCSTSTCSTCSTTCSSTCAVGCGAGNRLNGDPCTSNGECESGYCTGSWCGVQNCTSNEDCGFSSSGDLVWCGEVSGGGYGCFPGCNSSADCA
ncbi:MAG TPA: hypothetical protein VGM56_16310, partial [Byssovorax sp.]